MRILVAVDDSEPALRAVRYVGGVLHRTPHAAVTLFHVLKPMPRELLEHGGSENPATEAQLGAQLRREQEAWVRTEREAECPILKTACATLAETGFDPSRVTLQFGHEDDVAGNIVEEARRGRYDTIALGRRHEASMAQLFGGGVTDRVLRDAKDLAVWVVA